MTIKKTGPVKKILISASALALVLNLAACGQNVAKNEEFKPKLSTDTSCHIKVAGTYSNFESLESEKMNEVIESAEVLSDSALGIDLSCIREGARWS